MLHLDSQEAVDWEREQMEAVEADWTAEKELRIEELGAAPDDERVRSVLILAAQELKGYLRGQIQEQLSIENWDMADRPDLLGDMIDQYGQRRFPTAFALVEVYNLLDVDPAVGIPD